jgi:hypothetical protein
MILIAPALAAGVLFEIFLGHRHDYAGHFLAGYGASLGLLMCSLWLLPAAKYPAWNTAVIVPLTLVCILLGVGTELTIFRIAKFDEIDFCNQSLGAVLAGIAALAYGGRSAPLASEILWALIVSIAFLGAGGVYALA